MLISPVTSTAIAKTVAGTSTAFGATMVANQYFVFQSSTNCWINQGATPTAVANTNGNTYVGANTPTLIDGAVGADLAVIQDAAGGKASLTRIKTYG